ncbi:cell wall hydrolase [Altererythrobacter sp. GH1-8]|uniref:cell wall hydrolase n=1 Tax=Altererythrobacter sp. GH1-8 TaxID=3349333 RepID=UPI00374D8289
MSRKAFGLSALALVAGVSLTVASEESSSAFAQELNPAEFPEQSVDAAADPIFIAQEVVQPIAEPAVVTSDDETAPAAPSSLRDLVAQIETRETLSEQMQCLAGAIYFEARGEPLAGQLAVAQVVINRAESPRFPASYCDVVYQRAQFSFVKNGSMPKIRTGSAAWERAKAIARIAHEGLWDSAADDSLYFHAKYVRPAWSRKKAHRATISTHLFYR